MISAVVLSHNDCLNIERTLQSLIWCDEIVVIDDFSTDATADIAKKHGATVYSRHLTNDFSAQRNFGLSKVKESIRNASPASNAEHSSAGWHSDAGGDWILFVDSDEVVTPELAKEIIDLTSAVIPAKAGIQAGSPIKSGMTEPLGYFINRRDFLFGKWLRYGETANVKLLRLAKKDAGVWIRPVHEVWDIQGPTGILKNPLLHYPHPNVAQFIDDINVYSTLSAQYLFGIKAPFHVWHILVYPKAKFFLNYVVRLGFLDGMQGLIVALLMSFHSFLTRGKLWSLYQKQQKIL